VAALGTHLGGYRIEGIIKEGGGAVVCQARGPEDGQPVALKVFVAQPGNTGHSRMRSKSRREAKMQARVSHPSVLPVLEVGEADGKPFIAFPLVHGNTLTEEINRSGVSTPLQGERVLGLLAQVAGALDALHDADVVHRDVTANNILITDSDHAYLVDFEAARRREERNQRSAEDERRPKRRRRPPCVPATDISLLTACLSHALTGRYWYQEVRGAGDEGPRSDRIPRVATLRPDLRAEIDNVIEWGIGQGPGEPPATATAVIHAAADALGRGSTAARV
jgi:serine/threonine protein kinase